MGVVAEDNRSKGRPAKPLFPLPTVHTASPRTKLATLEKGVGFLDALPKLPLLL
jgi:hypothetical protein